MSLRRPAPWAWGVAAVALLALNLRPGATSLGPVLAEVRDGLGMDAATAGALTGLPGLAFAVFGALAVALALRTGLVGALALGASATGIGLIGRAMADSIPAFFALTTLAFAGMAVGNVLVPAYIKRHHAARVPLVMSIYTAGLAVGATVGALVSAPLTAVAPGGWRTALGLWGLVALVAAAVWIGLAVSERRRPDGSLTPRMSASPFGVISSPKAVALALFFGTQSMQAYVQFGWIAQIYRDGGLGAGEAGAMASVIAVFGVPAGFVMPTLVARVKNLRWVVLAMGVLLVAGYLGIWLAPTSSPFLWAILLGLSGCAFPMALALITARTRDYHVTGQLSGFTQSVGYLFSAAGPLLVGVMFQLSGGWTVPLWFLIASAVVFTASGLVASAPGYVDDELRRA